MKHRLKLLLASLFAVAALMVSTAAPAHADVLFAVTVKPNVNSYSPVFYIQYAGDLKLRSTRPGCDPAKVKSGYYVQLMQGRAHPFTGQAQWFNVGTARKIQCNQTSVWSNLSQDRVGKRLRYKISSIQDIGPDFVVKGQTWITR